MDDARPRNPDSWDPPGLWAPLSGHLVHGLVTAPVVLVLLWLATLLPDVPSRGGAATWWRSSPWPSASAR